MQLRLSLKMRQSSETLIIEYDRNFKLFPKSSLSLQMCLYFDAIFYIIWVSTSITSLILRSDHLDEIWFVSLVAATALFILINPPRIYLGLFQKSSQFFNNIKTLFPPGLEPGTFRVLGERDNHYTTETYLLSLLLTIKSCS